jgi:fido (protein-threonine AMPylation protein)
VAIIVASDLPDRATGSRLTTEGKLIRLTRGIYSDEVRKAPELIVAENWTRLLSLVMPNAVIVDRSAFTMRPVDGYVFVVSDRARNIELPGLTIVSRTGLPAQPDDIPGPNGIAYSSEQRGLIENLTPSRSVAGRPQRTLKREELHDVIVGIASTRSSEKQERLQAAVHDFADRAGRPDDATSIDVFFESARGERPTVQTKSKGMLAAQTGASHDPRRAQRFEQLAADLLALQPRVRLSIAGPDTEYLPFFDAYFSNFIEGTEFTVQDAADIVLRGIIPEDRPEDAHDVLGTYRILNDHTEMSRVLTSADDFLVTLQTRHAAIMEARPGKHPGKYKTRANRAGETLFVDPALVEGTLRAGWDSLQSLRDPFARATFMMFLVSEVHPFDDGNGRLSRMMMNSEFAQQDSTQILIPTVLRSDYLSALAALTHNGRHGGLVNVLDFAQRYTAQIDFSDFARAHQLLGATHSYIDSSQAERRGIRLILPSALPLGWESAPPLDADGNAVGQSILESINAVDAGNGVDGSRLREGDRGALTDRGRFAADRQSPPDLQLNAPTV